MKRIPVTPTFLAWVEDKTKAYRSKRRAWARKIGRPYSHDLDRPDPGELAMENTGEEG